MRYSGIGGQAVIEGVMMKNGDKCAVSVRKPDGKIEVKTETRKSLKDKHKVAALPVVRGVVTFTESLVSGMGSLNYSASLWEEEEEKEEKKGKENDLVMGLVIMLAVILAVGLFVLLPFFVSELLSGVIPSAHLRGLMEGVIRVVLFVGYVKAISYMEDIRRVFMYHGAEHKCINCVENGYELTTENVKKQTTVHKRCGTSFMLVVMLISILLFMFIVVSSMWVRMLLRILLIPVIAGISYECILFAGKSDNIVIHCLSQPGLWLQSLTTKEPDDDMIEVAISSVEAVFDWKSFLAKKEENGQDEAAVAEEMKEAGFEVVEVEEEEDDEILQALDRYFEAPGAQSVNQGGETK